MFSIYIFNYYCAEHGLICIYKTHLKRLLQIFLGLLHFEYERAFRAMVSQIFSGHGYPHRILSGALAWSPRDVSPLRRTLPWRCLHKILHLLRSVAGDGFCSTDGQRESARFRSLAQCATRAALSNGISRARGSQHLIGCQRAQGLAHLRGLGSNLDQASPQTLRRRAVRPRTGSNRLSSGCDGDQSVPGAFPLGSFSLREGGDQIAYALGSARLHPNICHSDRGRSSRGQLLGRTAARGRSDLRDGPRLSGFRSVGTLHPSGLFLCDPRQNRLEILRGRKPSGRPFQRPAVRSNDSTPRLLFQTRLSPAPASRPLLRRRAFSLARFPHQSLWPIRPTRVRGLPRTLADRTVFQMDQGTSQDSLLRRHHRERRAYPNLDCA